MRFTLTSDTRVLTGSYQSATLATPHNKASKPSQKLFEALPIQRLLATIAVSGALTLTGCGNSPSQEHAAEQGTAATSTATTASSSLPSYKVFTDADGMPFTFRDTQGDVQGFDIDVMNAIAEDQGFAVTYDILPWSTILPGMGENKADMAIAHISITEERQKTLSFSAPYFNSSQVALVKPEFAQAKSFTELKDAKISVLKGSITEDLFNSMNVPTTAYDKIFPMVTSLIKDEADAMVLDIGIVDYYQNEYKDEGFTIIADDSVPTDDYGIVVSKGQPDLLNKVNAGLSNIKQNGKYQQIHQKWFGH